MTFDFALRKGGEDFRWEGFLPLDALDGWIRFRSSDKIDRRHVPLSEQVLQ